jgi:hypothetical protein
MIVRNLGTKSLQRNKHKNRSPKNMQSRRGNRVKKKWALKEENTSTPIIETRVKNPQIFGS